eukprot:9758202-Alexandrium_andersonii.AAC.1
MRAGSSRRQPQQRTHAATREPHGDSNAPEEAVRIFSSVRAHSCPSLRYRHYVPERPLART